MPPPRPDSNPERYARLRDLVDAALERSAGERAAFLEERCAGDAALLREAMELVDVSPVEAFLESPLLTHSAAERTSGLAGRSFGEFDLEEEIGRGGMGVVYRATQRSLAREVAVKVVANPLLLASSKARERFQREARGAARLDHPAIARVLTSGEVDGLPYLAMELVRGETLGARVRATDPPATRAEIEERCRWVRDVASALAAAHEAGIVHRDVKPQNVLIGADGAPKLVDFGVARNERLGSISATGELIGTPHYMSPEQLRAENERVDARTDVYSAGVVLFEALTGERPYAGDTVLEMIDTIQRTAAPRPRALNARLPKELDWIVQRAIEVEPEHRYSSAAELAEDLTAFLETGAPRTAGPRPRARALASAVRRRRRPLLAGILALLAAAVAFLALRPPPPPATTLDVESEAAARVVALPFDPATGVVLEGEPLELGRTPLAGARLPLGSWAIRLEDGDRLIGEARVVARDPEVPVALTGFRARTSNDGMVRIPAGIAHLNAGPVELPAYWIDAEETSNRAYLTFVEATGHRAPDFWPDDWATDGLPPEWLDRPVVDVDLEDARAFARWSGKRLPTYAEWVRAASGDEGWRYPWGDEFTEADEVRERANVALKSYGRPEYVEMDEDHNRRIDVVRAGFLAETLPVTQPPEHRSPFGVSRMLGNVAEWTSSVQGGSGDANDSNGPGRVVAGCSWDGHPKSLRTQILLLSVVRSEFVGFRCALSRLPHSRVLAPR
ncbi:MAG: bifunctional serine/threonine-protein kinase/formylglycine-generating enzyme family protein [Planctomycetota bacterium]